MYRCESKWRMTEGGQSAVPVLRTWRYAFISDRLDVEKSRMGGVVWSVGRKEREGKGRAVDSFKSNVRVTLRSETVEGRSRGRGVYDDGVEEARGEAATGAVQWSGRRERRRAFD